MIPRRCAILGATTLAGREVADRLRDRSVAVGEIITCEPGSDADIAARADVSAARSERAVVGRLADDDAGGAWAFAAADSLAFGSVGGPVALLERSTLGSR